ncbi:MAG: beta-ketoacyl synthase N-terminal-like domain-containing protein [Desulfobacterales bacterium]
MTGVRIFITGMGVVSPLGSGVAETRAALAAGRRYLGPLSLFETPDNAPLPVGQIRIPLGMQDVPRTHQLARMAADQAMANCREAPDAVVVGTTTGGMRTTEDLLKEGVDNPAAYRWHAAGSVAEDIADRVGCKGAVLTVSTACSSGAVAFKMALEMLRTGKARRVLAGGVDSLCRLTYYGFSALKLIDPLGARPFDKDRRGMSVGEGAAMLLLVADDSRNAVAEFLGAGLSCDAYHPTAPHPEGRGAYAAMVSAIADAGLAAADVDYINLHGTGTPDNDLAEARAVERLFGDRPPPISSIKGAAGHPLAAAGALAAVTAAICIDAHLIPANTGACHPDPELRLAPVTRPRQAALGTVLVNSFGFGGNNAAVVIGAPAAERQRAAADVPCPMLVTSGACMTGAGTTDRTLTRMRAGESCKGVLSLDNISAILPAHRVRRLKCLPRMVMALAEDARSRSEAEDPPATIFFGTGWGSLSETHAFLKGLYETGERFPSPTDFIGSVHNAPAGQVAMMFGTTGANVTTTGGDASFEQALIAAGYLGRGQDRTTLVVGADEYHEPLSALFDPSVRADDIPSAGGAALLLNPDSRAAGVTVFPAFYARADKDDDFTATLVNSLGGPERIRARFGALLAGIPAAQRQTGAAQLEAFRACSGISLPVIEYRKYIGEFATASAVALFMAVTFTQAGTIPAPLCNGRLIRLADKGTLVLGFGNHVTAVEVLRR